MGKVTDEKSKKKTTNTSSRNVKKKPTSTTKKKTTSTAKKTTTKKVTKKPTKKTTKKVTPKKVQQVDLSNTQLLDQIMIKNKIKKIRKKDKKKAEGRLLVDGNTVENKIVQQVMEVQEKERKKKEDSLIITREINLDEYLREQNGLPPRKDFLELEEELYPKPPKKKREVIKDKYKEIKDERKAKRIAKYEKEIEEALERRLRKAKKKEIKEQAKMIPKEPKLPKQVKPVKQQKQPKEKVKIEYKYSRSIIPGILVAIACLILVLCFTVMLLNEPSNAVQLEEIDISSNLDYGIVKAVKEVCLSEGYNENDNTENIKAFTSELDEFLKGYNASVYYYDLNRGFNYSYNADNSHYAASVVKLIPALYVYEKANSGELDLDQTVTYNANYNYSDSAYFDTALYGTKVSIKSLVKYSLIYSDNSAYMMLVNYLGIDTLKDYASSMGINNYMDTDNFGHIKANEAINLIKRLNSLLANNNSTTNELKGYLVESDKNYLKLDEDGISAASKYGESYPSFNEIGIVYDEYPYGIVILTQDMGSNIDQEVKAINKKIYELHKKYYLNRTAYCGTIRN